MAGKHAILSPSGAPAWTRCHAKVHREEGVPDESSEYAEEGTAAHFLQAHCLATNTSPHQHVGRVIALWVHPESDSDGEDFLDDLEHPNCLEPGLEVIAQYDVTDEMAGFVETVIQRVREKVGDDGQLLVEQKLSIEHITGEEGATGTSDVVILRPGHLIIDDLKYGMGVEVYAEENEQLVMYAGAALEEFDLLGDIDTVTMGISQPRKYHFDEWTISAAELRERVAQLRAVADQVSGGQITDPTAADYLAATPGEKQCRFCRVRATCHELQAEVLATVQDSLEILPTKTEAEVPADQLTRIVAQAYSVAVEDVTFDPHQGKCFVAKVDVLPPLPDVAERIKSATNETLGRMLAAVPMIEKFCSAVGSEAHKRLLEGSAIPGYKLVEGKRGHRKWLDDKAVERLMVRLRLKQDQRYERKLISVPTAEKLFKQDKDSWEKFKKLITQSEGAPAVVPAADPRPPLVLTPALDQLDVIETCDLV
ncbi:MAG: DUF2800 domain-containing protein [Burkholderiales bacterium]|nr:DUF2800 domain-containing protein [Burkholderiales bacterium]